MELIITLLPFLAIIFLLYVRAEGWKYAIRDEGKLFATLAIIIIIIGLVVEFCFHNHDSYDYLV